MKKIDRILGQCKQDRWRSNKRAVTITALLPMPFLLILAFAGAVLLSSFCMNEPFDLPITYKGKQILFPARLLQFGYTHRFSVDVNGAEVLFERDEEGEYRAIVHPDALPKNFETSLLQAIAEAIIEVLR